MIRKIKVTDYPRLIEIWESAVLSTHDFLKEEDFLYYKEQLPVYFQYVTLFGFEQEGILIGLWELQKEILKCCLLTIIITKHRNWEKTGYLCHKSFAGNEVDVNEQNIQAVGFYKYIGFNVYKRSDLDGEGKEYPILHMQL